MNTTSCAILEINKIMNTWSVEPEIIMVDTALDLPIKAPAHTLVSMYDNKIYFVSANIKDAKDIQLAIGQAALRHISLVNLYGDEKEFCNYLNGVMKFAREEGSTLYELLTELEVKYPYASDAFLANELVTLAIKHSLNDKGHIYIEFSFIQLLFDKAEKFVKKIGLDVPFTNQDLQTMVIDAGQLVAYTNPFKNIGIENDVIKSNSSSLVH